MAGLFDRIVHGSPLKADECVMAIPGLLRVGGLEPLRADIDVWVYENENRPGMRSLFARYLDVDLNALDAQRRNTFDRRTRLFLRDSERHKRLSVMIEGYGSVALSRTDPAGRSNTAVTLPRELWSGEMTPLHYRLPVVCPGEARHGQLWPILPEGLSVVSDIDDTIKISEVRDTKALLRNTFLEPFEPVPGMAAWYRHIERQIDGADPGVAVSDGTPGNVRFHYLSSSPLQLLPVLDVFLKKAGFPAGPMVLRESTAWKDLLPGKGDSEAHKLGHLHSLMREFPRRRFVLIGDSGEADPEIYARIARQYPVQVVGIFIRNVSDEAADAPRYLRLFDDIPRRKWHVFQHGDEARAAFDALQPQ